jgi:hypothetical protein
VLEPLGIPENWRLLHAFSQVGGRASMTTKPAGKSGGQNRLGVAGEYQPQRLSLDRHDARRRFFQILAREQPEIFTDLRAVYQTVQHNPELWHYPKVPDGLRKWGKRWHLHDPWCLDLAREAFAEWDAERKGEKLTVGAKTHSGESAALGMLANQGIVLGTWKGNFDADGDPIPGEHSSASVHFQFQFPAGSFSTKPRVLFASGQSNSSRKSWKATSRGQELRPRITARFQQSSGEPSLKSI